MNARRLHGDHTKALDALHHLTETQRRDPDTLAGFARWAGAEPPPATD